MPKAHDILGMNARNSQYISQNNTQAKSVASSKYATKILLEDNNIPTPKIYAILATNEDVQDFDWKSIEGSFVVKPTNGHAGKGVLILNKKSKHTDTWSNTLGQQLSPDDIKL
ncbi:MAG: ATP-grasp domain-containing protein, partial [Pseudomonadales bacterium]|nr:ATP-grasp domain-containing protein [Pseudomonadales bacterium]